MFFNEIEIRRVGDEVEQIVPEQNQMAYKINDGTGKIWAKLYVGHGETPAQVEESATIEEP